MTKDFRPFVYQTGTFDFNIPATLVHFAESIRTNCDRSAPFLETNFPEFPDAVRASRRKVESRQQAGKILRARRQKMPSCPMYLADTMKFRPYLAVRNVTVCVSTCISGVARRMYDTARDSVHPETSSGVRRSFRERVCENTTCPQERFAKRIPDVRPPSYPASTRQHPISRSSKNSAADFRARGKVLVPRYRRR